MSPDLARLLRRLDHPAVRIALTVLALLMLAALLG